MKCVFIGVSEECKAYMLYNLITKKIIISKDILFDEENIWVGATPNNNKF